MFSSCFLQCFHYFRGEKFESYAEPSSQRRYLIDNFLKIKRKFPQDAADADFTVGCGSALLHPVSCPVKLFCFQEVDWFFVKSVGFHAQTKK